MPRRTHAPREGTIRVVLLASTALLLPIEAFPEERAETLSAAMKELAEMDSVEASAIGIGGVAGRFWELFQVIRREGGSRTFVRLTRRKNPVCRAMGLLCLAQKYRKRAVPILAKSLTDQGGFTYFPGGCCGCTGTVGEISWDLLVNANHLGAGPPHPLVGEKCRVGIALQLLSEDTPFMFNVKLKMTIEEYLEKHKGPGLSQRLLEDFPAVPSSRIAEALAQLEGDLAKEVLAAMAEEDEPSPAPSRPKASRGRAGHEKDGRHSKAGGRDGR